MTKEKKITAKQKEGHNLCRACGRIIYGLSPCSCDKSKENVKLWNNGIRRQDRIRLKDRIPDLKGEKLTE